MQKIEHECITQYPIELIYQLIIDIEKYPEFIPWCQLVNIIEKQKAQMIADLSISYKLVSETYRSKIDLCPPKKDYAEINVSLISGPFKKLESKWLLKREKNSNTKINFFVDFEFKSALLDKLMGLMFHKACEKIMQAFERRAEELFSTPDGSRYIANNRRGPKKT